METHLEIISALPIAYMRRIGPYGEQNYRLMQDMKDWIVRSNLSDIVSVIYGIAQDNPATTPPDECRYDVCISTETPIKDASIHHGTLSAGEYLVFEVLHTADEVQRFWQSIGLTLEQERRQLDHTRPIIERYQFALIEKGYCEFCVPVV